MAARRLPGNPGKIIGFFRDTLLGRPALDTPWLRTPASVASRSPGPANIPGGPAHKLAANYYFTRDMRRDVFPPTLTSSPLTQIEEGENKTKTSAISNVQSVSTTPPVPGVPHVWREI